MFHHEAEFLEDIRVLSQYIQEELNVREVRLSNDEVACGVKWKVDADWPVLGKKLRKDLPRLKKALPSVTSEEVKNYVETGKITIDGIELVAGDLTTQRYVDLPASSLPEAEDMDAAQYSSDSNKDVVLLLDTKVRPDFVKEAYAREISNRVQKARKRAGCQTVDDMEVYLAYADEEGRELLNMVIRDKADVLGRTIRRLPVDDAQRDTSRPVYYEDPAEHEEEVGGAKFRIVLLEHGSA